tara:strand:+ start:240 stop:548 length:309 start_codon:yes stop_codon:yes gene_type:complete
MWVLAAFAVVVFLGAVFWTDPVEDQTYTLGAIVLLLWALSLVVVAEAFATPAPEIDPRSKVMDRLRARLSRGFRWIMAITTTGLFGFVILLSFKSLGLLIRG